MVRSNPSASPVFIDPQHVHAVEIDFTDLGALTGAALARAACARVFSAVFDELCGEDELPPRDGETRARARAEAVRLLQVAADTTGGIEVRPWAERIASEMCGLGALSARLAEADVQEIFVHGPDRVLVRRGSGAPVEIDAKFSCPQAIEIVVRRLTGTNFGVENPIVDARTLDGADVYAVHESVAPVGPVVNITLPSPSEPRWTLERLLQDGVLSPSVANLLSVCVQAGIGILVCAGPGARAFPILAALIDAAPASDRHVLVRPMSEPGLLPPSIVVLEGDGLVGTEGTTVMQALVRTAVGLRPDRLALHETVGPEAGDLLAVAGRGLSGVCVSTRASTADAGLQRLAAMAGSSIGHDLATRMQTVARSLELVITVGRFPDGNSRVIEIAESRILADGSTSAVEIIGIDPRTGTWRHTGAVPQFFGAMQRRGIVVDAAMLAG
jgi:pilus assembly protein CpaF